MPPLIPGDILIVEILKHTFLLFFVVVKRQGKNFWQPEIDTWGLKILVKSPHGDQVKKLFSDPV